MSSNTLQKRSDLLNTLKIYEISVEGKKRIFENPYIIGLVLLLVALFIAYAAYAYVNKSQLNIKSSTSYYGKDLAFYTPIFNNTQQNITDCIAQCQNDLTCDGITYNADTSYCTGTKDGVIRTDLASLSAWVKPVKNLSDKNIADITKSVIIGNTHTSHIVDSLKFANPYIIGQYSYAFTLTIFDFYANFGVWRHIFHKGTPVDMNGKLNYQSWETLSNDIPDQTIGVWIAPFTNNLRIAVSTTTVQNRNVGTYPDAFVQKCKDDGGCYVTDLPSGKWTDTSRLGDNSTPAMKVTRQLEYFDHDLQRFPINSKINFTINLMGNYLEVFINGKIVKSAMLNGVPNFNKSPLYAMFDKTVNGELHNLVYFPTNMLMGDVKQIAAL
jgi:hypothetical protein